MNPTDLAIILKARIKFYSEQKQAFIHDLESWNIQNARQLEARLILKLIEDD